LKNWGALVIEAPKDQKEENQCAEAIGGSLKRVVGTVLPALLAAKIMYEK
jgi:hypothetical protein